MSGEESNKLINRRTFIKLAGIAIAFPACSFVHNKNSFPTIIAGANSQTGHLLRENKFPEPSRTEKISLAIVGGGVSGLSASRWLKKNGFDDFKLFELDTAAGGNSKSGKNEVSSYPFAAHYLPIPNENFKELIDFLSEHNVITGFDEKNLPIYNEYYICFEPEERLFYRGIWQDGLPPKTGLNENEISELSRFFKQAEIYKNAIGKDNLPAFAIPLEFSSKDDEFMQLDYMTFEEYLKKERYTSSFLLWYLNYCCKDDYGTSIVHTSAWAAFHYFACRSGKASNAESSDVLTWPEGNNFLVKKLTSQIESHVHTEMLTYRVDRVGDFWNCYVFDVKTKQSVKYICDQVILATPQFVNKKILIAETTVNWDEFSYYPWIVANITIKDKKELNGLQSLSWDNVLYDSKSLGYVNACHQSFDMHKPQTVITYYYNFSEKSAKEERQAIYEKDESYWKNFIIDDLKKSHPDIEQIVESIDVNVLGHGMVSPVVNFRTSHSRRVLGIGLDNLYFAHSDISGISIFEQAFYRGIFAANQVLKQRHEHKL